MNNSTTALGLEDLEGWAKREFREAMHARYQALLADTTDGAITSGEAAALRRVHDKLLRLLRP